MAGPCIRAKTGLQQKNPFGALVFSLGSGTAPLPWSLLLGVCYRVENAMSVAPIAATHPLLWKLAINFPHAPS